MHDRRWPHWSQVLALICAHASCGFLLHDMYDITSIRAVMRVVMDAERLSDLSEEHQGAAMVSAAQEELQQNFKGDNAKLWFLCFPPHQELEERPSPLSAKTYKLKQIHTFDGSCHLNIQRRVQDIFCSLTLHNATFWSRFVNNLALELTRTREIVEDYVHSEAKVCTDLLIPLPS